MLLTRPCGQRDSRHIHVEGWASACLVYRVSQTLSKVQWRGSCCWKWRRQGGELNRKKERVAEQTHRKCAEEMNITSCGFLGVFFLSSWKSLAEVVSFILLFFSLPFPHSPFPFMSPPHVYCFSCDFRPRNLGITIAWQNYTRYTTIMTFEFISLRSKASFMRHCHVKQHHESERNGRSWLIYLSATGTIVNGN